MNKILNPHRQPEKPPISKVLSQIKKMISIKQNPTTIIMTDYDKKFIRNTITSKLVNYRNGREFGTLEYLDSNGNTKKFKQDENVIVYYIDNKAQFGLNLNEKSIDHQLEKVM